MGYNGFQSGLEVLLADAEPLDGFLELILLRGHVVVLLLKGFVLLE